MEIVVQEGNAGYHCLTYAGMIKSSIIFRDQYDLKLNNKDKNPHISC